jgi:CHAD domain-containing protein
MPYRLRADEEVQDGLRRCAREQLDRAIAELTTGLGDDPVSAVHDARKALKKTRSLLRLSRGTIPPKERRRANATLRHAGRRLSPARDAEVMLEAVDDLAERFVGQVPQPTFDAIRRHLEADRAPARQRLLDADLPGDVAEELKSARARTADWTLRVDGWKALESGLFCSYKRGRQAFEQAREHPSTENLHQWRKRTKDLWYHLRMLKPVSPGILTGHADEAHELADLLGDDHDLAVLHSRLERGASQLPVDLDCVLELIDHRQEQLQAQAFQVGERLYAEPPKAFLWRLHRYWKASRGAAAASASRRPRALARA